MRPHLVQILIDATTAHPLLTTITTAPLAAMLTRIEPTESACEPIPLLNNQALIPDGPCRYHQVSFRRILYNRGEWPTTWRQAIHDRVVRGVSGYSSDAMARSVKATPDVAAALRQSPSPFSILGKLETFDYNNPDEHLFHAVRPILIVPGAPNRLLQEWEENHTKYECERSHLLFSTHERLSKEEYLTGVAVGTRTSGRALAPTRR